MIETRYFVSYFLHNKQNEGWAYKTIGSYSDLSLAKKAYHGELATYIGSTAFDNVAVILNDSFGNVIQNEWWQEPQPEPEPDETDTTILNSVVTDTETPIEAVLDETETT